MKKLMIIMLCMQGMYNNSCKKASMSYYRGFQVNDTYFKTYIHLQQKNGESAWTNYVLILGAIYKTHHIDYNVNYDEVEWVRSHCKNSSSLETLENYARDYDRQLFCRYETSYEPEFLKTHLPCIITIENGEQHLIIWDVDWKEEMVYYTDSRLLPQTPHEKNLQKISLPKLLEDAKHPNYQFLFLWKKQKVGFLSHFLYLILQ